MRHGKKTIKLGRKSAHRKAMLANMAVSLIEHKRITTTSTKAKALKIFIEPLITKSKNDNTHNRRLCFSKLRNKDGVKTLFDEIAQKVANRPGGYTRIIKAGFRYGDNAPMAIIEFVDRDVEAKKVDKKKKSTSKEPEKKEDKKASAESK